jgi:hypothetical protein
MVAPLFALLLSPRFAFGGSAEQSRDDAINGKSLNVQPLEMNGGRTFGLTRLFESHPGVAPGDLVSGALVSHWESDEGLSLQLSHRYHIDELIRVKGAKNFVERARVAPVFFTPAIGHLDSTALPSSGETLFATDSALSENHLVEDEGGEFSTNARLHGSWCLRRRCNRGAHGEIWRATRSTTGSAESKSCI